MCMNVLSSQQVSERKWQLLYHTHQKKDRDVVYMFCFLSLNVHSPNALAEEDNKDGSIEGSEQINMSTFPSLSPFLPFPPYNHYFTPPTTIISPLLLLAVSLLDYHPNHCIFDNSRQDAWSASCDKHKRPDNDTQLTEKNSSLGSSKAHESKQQDRGIDGQTDMQTGRETTTTRTNNSLYLFSP